MKNFIVNLAHLVQASIYASYNFIKEHLVRISAHTLGWVVIVLLHFASVPTLLSVMSAKTDVLPPIDIMIFIWAALTTLFVKALLEKDRIYIATIGVGFIAQTVMMGLIVFK
jgi:hypothetical protein